MSVKKQKIRLLPVLTILIMTGILCSCGKKEKEEVREEFPITLEEVGSTQIATNKRFSLEWDNEKCCVLLKQNDSEKVWSSIPYDFYQTTESDEDMSSPIYIEYVDGSSMISVVSKGFSDSVTNRRVASKTLENGIEVTYYFDNVGIAVPVQYCLREDALEVSVNFKNVQEGEHHLLSVSVAPFLCSASNGSEDSYIVVPSGSGALMYLDERAEGTRMWSGEIYGSDPARLLPEELSSEEAVRLPIFGIKEGRDALLAIVEEGREAAVITAVAGDARSKHSNAYVSFYARGYDNLESTQSWSTRDVYRTEEDISVEKATVAFYPLSNEEANYVGMASFYQAYLKENGMQDEKHNEQTYALYFAGGATIKELFIGVPVEKTKALTTFTDVKNILEDITTETGSSPAVQLNGFGKTGLDKGQVAGGFEFSDAFGSQEQRLALEEFCADEKIPMYTDFDLIYFCSNGSGFNTLMGAAKSASMRKATQYYKDKALWHYDKDVGSYYLLKREEIQKAVDKLKDVAKKAEVSGISLSTLGQTAYSDYTREKYSARGNSIIDTQNYLSQFKDSGIKIATQSANDYAAILSDSVFEVPVDDGGYINLDASIPLYQMVLKGFVPMYSTPINTTSDFEKSLMLAVQGGVSPGFSVIGTYDVQFAKTTHTELHASAYEGNKDAIMEAITKCTDYYVAIQGQTITNYEFVSKDVTKTSFSNGVIVYANHSKQVVDTPLGELEAYGFAYAESEVME